MVKKIIKNGTIQEEILKNDFRVAIFGSARIKNGEKLYEQIFDLAKEIGKNNIDIVTGGGHGVMEAANAGHIEGDKDNKVNSIGLVINLPWEKEGNHYLEIEECFDKFSYRLDHFMALSNAVVIMPGGVGTCLELFYTWQLVQVKHVRPIPIILVGDMWEDLYKWVKKHLVDKGMISPSDTDYLHIAKNNKEVLDIIMDHHAYFKKEGKNYYKEIKKYSLDV